MSKQWAPASSLPEEDAAYARLQAALAQYTPDSQSPVHTLTQQEAQPTDFTTSKGRKSRSALNLQYMRARNADCPLALQKELESVFLAKKIALQFEYRDDHQSDIMAEGRLLSNAQLQKRGEVKTGSTYGSVIDDDKEFGNTDFVFTRPLLYNEGGPAGTLNSKFLIPADKLLANEHAWLSFDDWADYSWGCQDRDQYAGNRWRDDKTRPDRQAFIADFFMSADIAPAIALKTFEALKTAILITADETKPAGFDEEKAMKFLTHLHSPGFRRGHVRTVNTLEKPLADYTLSPRQSAFLTTRSPERDALTAQAVSATIKSLSDRAEVKVPAFISLDGAAIAHVGDDEKAHVTQLISRTGQCNTLTFATERGLTTTTVTVPPDPRTYPPQHKTQLS